MRNRHHEIFDVYRDCFGVPAPREFRRAYAVLCEALYWGVSPADKDAAPKIKGKKSPGEYWPLHEWRLLEAKGTADQVLASIARAIQKIRAEEASGQGSWSRY